MKLWIAGLALLVLVITVTRWTETARNGGWYGADGNWHSRGH
jgi:hypothetical protein